MKIFRLFFLLAIVFFVDSLLFGPALGAAEKGLTYKELGNLFKNKIEKNSQAWIYFGYAKQNAAKQFVSALTEIDELDRSLGKLKFGVAMSYEGNQSNYSGNDRDYGQVLGVETNMTKDLFPNELRFKAATNLVLGSNKFQNDVSSILFNYDYYLGRIFEAYLFSERFSDSFMGIKQRFEIGGGVKAEFKIGDPINNYDEKRDPKPTRYAEMKKEQSLVNKIKHSERAFRELIGELKTEVEAKNGEVKEADLSLADIYLIIDFLDEFDKQCEKLNFALFKKRSPLVLGVAASIFSEIEQATLSPYRMDDLGKKEVKSYTLDPEYRYRLTIRPSIEWAISDQTSFYTACYFKLPIFGKSQGEIFVSPDLPDEVLWKYDLRIDLISNIKFILAKYSLWGGEVSATIEYQFHYDEVPPSLSAKLGEINFKGMSLKDTIAANKHHYAMLKIGISFD